MKDGIYNISIEDYHANKTHLSASAIKETYKSLAHFKAYLDTLQERKSVFDFGNAFELSIQDVNGFKEKVAIYDESDRPEPKKTFGSKKNKEWKTKFYEDNKDKLIIPFQGQESVDTINILKKSLYSHQTAVKLLKNTNYQTSIFWTDKETGLRLKTRPDFWKPATDKRSAIIVDLKTDANSETDLHIKKICNLNYPIQAVMQIMGLRALGLINDWYRFFWIVVSKSSPYNTEVYEFEETDIEKFMDSFTFKLGEIKRAKENGLFLSYDPDRDYGIKTVEFPFYYKKKMGIYDEFND